jgi:DNA-binding beta-propeller fold protein YncE
LAVDTSTGHLYVADNQNNRIDIFDSAGTFLFAFGWKVNAAAPEEKLQTCTTATGCQQGTSGPGAGQFSRPENLAVDSSSHAVYISENAGHRVQKFDSEGHFIWIVGGEVDKSTNANLCTVAANCRVGKAGAEEGQFLETLGRGLQLAVGPGGVLYVADSKKLGPFESEGFKTRIQKFEPSGAYIGPQLLLPDTVGRVQAFVVDLGGNL